KKLVQETMGERTITTENRRASAALKPPMSPTRLRILALLPRFSRALPPADSGVRAPADFRARSAIMRSAPAFRIAPPCEDRNQLSTLRSFHSCGDGSSADSSMDGALRVSAANASAARAA